MLKKNIPGRYSWWDKDDDEEGERARAEWVDSEGSDNEGKSQSDFSKMQQLADDGVPEPVRNSSYVKARGGRTGPKGVIEDYKEHKKAEAEQREYDEAFRNAVLQRMACGAKMVRVVDDEEDLDDDEDDDFQREFRQRRIEELRAAHQAPVFGQVKEVSAFQFLDEINDEDPRVFVVAHIYEHCVQACVHMNRCLEVVAKEHTGIKILRLEANKTPTGFDPVTLPVLVVYRAGDLHYSVLQVTEKLGNYFDASDIEWLLSEGGVFDQSSVAGISEKSSSINMTVGTNRVINHRVNFIADNSDDDDDSECADENTR